MYTYFKKINYKLIQSTFYLSEEETKVHKLTYGPFEPNKVKKPVPNSDSPTNADQRIIEIGQPYWSPINSWNDRSTSKLLGFVTLRKFQD